MYRRRLPIYYRRNPLVSLLRVILTGMILGVGFLIFDRWGNPRNAPASVSSTAAPLTVIETLQPPFIPTSTPEPLISTAAPQTTLMLPTVGVNMPIIQVYLANTSWDVSHLGQNVGHLEGTAWFDRPGNVALSGHVELADGRAGVFSRLGQINPGDPVFVSYQGQRREYIVTEVRSVAPDDISVLYPTFDDRLTLITCDGYDFIQNAYLHRTVVIAERIT